MMNGLIVSFRRGRHNQTNNQMIIKVDSIKDRKKASDLIGKEIIFKTQTGKEIKGKITSVHGNSGCVRALFERGMPGQALAKNVEIK